MVTGNYKNNCSNNYYGKINIAKLSRKIEKEIHKEKGVKWNLK